MVVRTVVVVVEYEPSDYVSTDKKREALGYAARVKAWREKFLAVHLI